MPLLFQSRTQSPQALWPAVGRQERLWGTGISLPQDFCGKNNASRNGADNQKFSFFSNSPVSPSDQPLAKEPEDSGFEITVVHTLSKTNLIPCHLWKAIDCDVIR